MNRRIFLQPTDILEVVSSDGTSCVKIETYPDKFGYPSLIIWPQPRVFIQLPDGQIIHPKEH